MKKLFLIPIILLFIVSSLVGCGGGGGNNESFTKIYYVNPVTGIDSNDGSAAHPLKTITVALGKPGWKKVQLTAGTYSIASGETFPLNLKDHEELCGDSAHPENYIILDPTHDLCQFDNPGTATITGIEFNTFSGSLFIKQGVLTVTNCRFIGNSGGQTAIDVSGNAELSMNDCSLTGTFNWGIEASDTTKVTVSGGNISNCSIGINAHAGVELVLSGVEVTDNVAGLMFEGNKLAIHGCTFSDNNTGIYLDGSPTPNGINLGTVSVLGNNSIINNTISLYDNRVANNGILTAVGNSWSKTLSGTIVGPVANSPDYRIVNSGNSISFSNP